MTQYADIVKLQALKNEIDKWSQKIKTHNMKKNKWRWLL